MFFAHRVQINTECAIILLSAGARPGPAGMAFQAICVGPGALGAAQLSPVICRHGVWQASETGHPFPGISKRACFAQAAGRRKERVEPYGFHRHSRRGRPCWPDCFSYQLPVWLSAAKVLGGCGVLFVWRHGAQPGCVPPYADGMGACGCVFCGRRRAGGRFVPAVFGQSVRVQPGACLADSLLAYSHRVAGACGGACSGRAGRRSCGKAHTPGHHSSYGCICGELFVL